MFGKKVKEVKETSHKEHVDNQIEILQDEYLELLLEMKKDGSEVKHEYLYRWERLKKLQRMITTQMWNEREVAVQRAKDSLEQAFTPHLKKMLWKSLKKHEDSIIYEGERYVPEKSIEVNNDTNRDEENE